MKPEAAASLVRARRDLDEAGQLAATLHLNRLAARSAYYAAFHAAEALIIEKTGRHAKTHRGAHSEFARLMKDGDDGDRQLFRVLPDGFRYKEIADYSVDPHRDVSERAAVEIIQDATRLVARVAELLAGPPDTPATQPAVP